MAKRRMVSALPPPSPEATAALALVEAMREANRTLRLELAGTRRLATVAFGVATAALGVTAACLGAH